MLTISKPLSAGQAQTYHQKEFTAKEQNYWSQRGVIAGEWQGRLAAQFGLAGAVFAEDFGKLSQGQHPETGEQLVRQRASYEYQDADGKTVKTMEHRAGWDATFSAPKSVSLTALVGRDDRVREAHRESVSISTALEQLEYYTQARIGGNHPPEATGKFVAAKFEHDTARPVDGYVAPQLHTHAVIFNLTQRDNGQARAVQPQSLFASQQFATAVYQSELTYRLKGLGYEITVGRSGAPEIKGYIRVILRGKALEFFSRHYGKVLTAEDEPMPLRHALAGINQLLDEGTGDATALPPSVVQPVAYQYLRLFTMKDARGADDVNKSLFGTAIRQKDLADRDWIEERNKTVTAIPINDRFEHHRKRPRKEMKTEIDQAHFLIGAAMPNSGINLEDELTKDTWMLRKSVDSVLEWYAKVTPHLDVRNAAMLARTILRSSLQRLRERPGALEEQLSLFNDWDESES